MSDGTTEGNPNGQAPPTGHGASALNGRNGAAADPDATHPQPAVRSASGPANPPNGTGTVPNGHQPAATQPAQPERNAQPTPARTSSNRVPVWDTNADPSTKPSLMDRLGNSLGLRNNTEDQPAGSDAPSEFRGVANPPPGLTAGAQLQPRVAPGAPVVQPVVPGQGDRSVERGPITQTLPVVPGPAPTSQTETQAAARAKVGSARRTRKARLRLSRLDPWSVMKTSFLFSIAAGIMLVVAVYAVWTVLNTSGLFNSVNDIVKSVVSTPGDTTPFRIQEYVNTQKVVGVAALVAVVDVLLITALATLGSFLYNLAATMLGGLEVTLAED